MFRDSPLPAHLESIGSAEDVITRVRPEDQRLEPAVHKRLHEDVKNYDRDRSSVIRRIWIGEAVSRRDTCSVGDRAGRLIGRHLGDYGDRRRSGCRRTALVGRTKNPKIAGRNPRPDP